MASVYAIAPPRPIKGPAPLLTTVHEVEKILRKAHNDDEGPISLAEVGRRMKAKSVRHSTIRACVDELRRLGFVTDSPEKGVMWTLHEDEKFWTAKGFVKL